MTFYGTNTDDFLIVNTGTTDVFARGGDDVIRSNTADDVKVDGGNGFDIFEFQLFAGQNFTMNETDADRTVIKIFEDGEQVQKIVLLDVEQIDWWMVA